MKSLRLNDQDLLAIRKNWGWSLAWGIALVILGFMAISAAALTTLISIIFLGVLLLISGVVILIDTFTNWWGKWNGFFLHLCMAILYLAAGILLTQSPMIGSLSITLMLGILYIIIGVFRTTYALSLQLPRWKWSFLNGIITLLLGILITINWPASGLIIIGLFIGIDLIFCGWAYILAALSARSFLSAMK